MGYTVSLASATVTEGSGPGNGGTFTFTLTRDAGDTNLTTYRLRVVSFDQTTFTDFASANSSNGGAATVNASAGGVQNIDFTWTALQTTTTLTLVTDPDTVAEGNESFSIFLEPVGGNAFFGPTTITINNDDVGAPVFSTGAAFTAAENQTAVATMAATGGGTVTYSLNGGADAGLFAINANTGVLTFTGNQDFEAPGDAGANRVYDVIIRATAGGLTTDKPITVTLTNVNDVTPAITSDGAGAAAALNVAENTTAVTTVTATDAETGNGANDTLTYSISAGADASKFTINGTTGALSFTSAPSFETRTDADNNGVYEVTVQVRDSGNLVDTQAISVTVTDVAENARITSSNGAAIAFVSAPENTLTTTTLTTFTAVDDDAGSGPMNYTITGGADAARFNLNLTTGVLTFAASPNFEAPADADGDNTYIIQVTANAGGGASTAQTVYVFVTNVIEQGVPTDVVTPGGGGGGGTPPNPFQGTAGADNLPGTDGDDLRQGGAGADTIDGGAGNDNLDGDDGDDYIIGGSGNDFIRGLNDNDIITGGDGADTVNGNTGADTVYGDGGDDQVMGGQGNDQVYGGEGNDFHVNGNMGEDLVYGGEGDDTVYGGQGNDTVYGENGADRLSGDLGFDILYGGSGADRFVIARGGSWDWVADFNAGQGDRIALAVGQTYTVTTVDGQTVIDLGNGDRLGLAGVSTFSADWIVFGG